MPDPRILARVRYLIRWCRGWLHWNRRLRDIANFVVPSNFYFVVAFRHETPMPGSTAGSMMWQPSSGRRLKQRAELDCLEAYVKEMLVIERDRLDALDEAERILRDV